MNVPGAQRNNVLFGLIRKPFRNFVISGVAKDQDGTVIPYATVRLFNTQTMSLIATQVADSTGGYSFNLGGDTSLETISRNKKLWWIAAYFGTGDTAIFGTTLNNLEADEQVVQ